MFLAPSEQRENCVFFTQHPAEKQRMSLWEGCFFIAPKTLSAKVEAATEGGIPVSRYPAGRIAPVQAQVWQSRFGSIAW